MGLQNYASKPQIEDIKILEIKNFLAEDGSFCEFGRISKQGELEAIPGFKPRQLNYSLMLPGSVKAWHLHFNQEDVWFAPGDSRLLVGLVDLRKKSTTKGIQMRFLLGGGQARLLYIPRGVAHGAANLSTETVRLIYLVNEQFNPKNPDEKRLPWNIFGEDFWKFKYA